MGVLNDGASEVTQGRRLFLRRKRRLCDTLVGNVFEARIRRAGGTLRRCVQGTKQCSFGLRSVSRRADDRRPCNRKVGG